MKQELEQEAELRRYLLGELTLDEQLSLEQRLFLDDEYAQLAQSVEDDLIDDYVHNDLTASEREEFKIHFLKRWEHREDTRIAEALNQYLTTNSKGKNHQEVLMPAHLLRRPTSWLAFAAVLILLSVITWIVVQSVRRPTGERLEAGGPQPVPTQSANPQQQPTPSQETVGHGSTPEPDKRPVNNRNRQQPERQPAPSFATVTIHAFAGTRGPGQTNEVTIPAEAKNVLLQLPVVTVRDYDKYHFELLSRGRALVVRNLNVSVDEKLGRMVSLMLPTKLFTQKNYEIRLRGITTDGRPGEFTTYLFTFTKQQQ